jgi:hypothetical protein
VDLLALVMAVAIPWLGPRVVEGRSALAWTRFRAARAVVEADPTRSAREAARQADRAIRLLAPLPEAGEAAVLALDVGREVEARDPGLAREVYATVGDSLAAVRAFAPRGLGLGSVAQETGALEASAARRLGSGADGKPSP